MATFDSPEGYLSVAPPVAQESSPIGSDEFRDGYGAVKALEAKYRLDKISRTQAFHVKLGIHYRDNCVRRYLSCASNPGNASSMS